MWDPLSVVAECFDAEPDNVGSATVGAVSGWACPHEDKGRCRKLRSNCDPGIAGCVLHGRVRFAGDSPKNATPEEAERARRRVEKKRSG